MSSVEHPSSKAFFWFEGGELLHQLPPKSGDELREGRRDLMLLGLATFLCFGVALNLFLASATGLYYGFWPRRRAKLVGMTSSPAARLLLFFIGFLFFLLTLFFGLWALANGTIWKCGPHQA